MDERPVARRTDPETSHLAAESVNVHISQARVLTVLIEEGPLHDEALIAAIRRRGWTMSDSGARTRRSELVAKGLVMDTGRLKVTKSGRRTIVWGVS